MRSCIVLPGLLGLARRAFGPHRVLARRTQRGFCGARGPIGLGGSVDRGGQAVGRRHDAPPPPPPGHPAPRRAAPRSAPGAASKAACSASAASRVPPARRPVRPASAARCPQSARSPAMADRARRADRHARAPTSRVRAAPRLLPTGRRQRRPRRLHRRPQRREVGQRGLRLARLRKAGVRLPRVSAVSRSICVSMPASRAAISVACVREAAGAPPAPARGRCSASRPPSARLLLGHGRCLLGLGRGVAHLARGGSLIARRGQIALQQRQPVALLQPNRRGGRRAGADRVAVPAPDRALA